jgi:hypothetical protein
LLEQARANRDLYLETFIAGAIQPLLHLADDEPDLAREAIDRSLAGWPAKGYHLQHALIDQVSACVALYSGGPPGAAEFMRRRWPMIRRGQLLYNQNLRAKLLETRVRCLLDASPGSATNTREAERVVSILEREREPYLAGCVLSQRAVLRRLGGARDHAERLLYAAIEAFDQWGMADYAASSRLTLANWRSEGNSGGRTAALEWFTRQGIQNPGRWVRMRLPDTPSPGG